MEEIESTFMERGDQKQRWQRRRLEARGSRRTSHVLHHGDAKPRCCRSSSWFSASSHFSHTASSSSTFRGSLEIEWLNGYLRSLCGASRWTILLLFRIHRLLMHHRIRYRVWRYLRDPVAASMSDISAGADECI